MKKFVLYIVLLFVSVSVGYSQSSEPEIAIDRIENDGLNRFICSSGVCSLDIVRNISWRYRVGVIESNDGIVPQYVLVITLRSIGPIYPSEGCRLKLQFQDNDTIELKNTKIDKFIDGNDIHTNVLFFAIDEFDFSKFKKGVSKVNLDVVGYSNGIGYLYREDVIGSFLYKAFLKVKERLHSDVEVCCC